MTAYPVSRRPGPMIARHHHGRLVLGQLHAEATSRLVGEHEVLAPHPERRLVAPGLDVDPLRLRQTGDDALETGHVVDRQPRRSAGWPGYDSLQTPGCDRTVA